MESCSREMGPLGLNSSMVIASLRFLSLFSSTACRRCRCIALKFLTLSTFAPVAIPPFPFLSFPSKLFVRTPHRPLQVDVTSTTSFSSLSLLVSDVDRTLSSFFVPFFRFCVSLFSLPLFTFRNTSTSQSHHVDTNHSLPLERTAVCR